MLILNKQKYAKNNSEMLDSLFNPNGTCCGTYEHTQNGTKLFNLKGELFAYLVHNGKQGYFAVTAYNDNGKVRYMFALCSSDEKYLGFDGLTMSQEEEIIKSAIKSLKGV